MDLEKEFIRLIKEHERIILRICNVYCAESADRADLYQDIAIQLWKSFPNFDRKSKTTTWMYRIALNTAISRFRKEKKRPQQEQITEQFTADSLHEEDQIRLLYDAIGSLNKIDKAITMLYLDGIPYREVGEIMGLSESNIGFKINRIKKKLREKLMIEMS